MHDFEGKVAVITGAAGAVNQRPGSPASWSPISVPLRAISDTTLDPSIPAAATLRPARDRCPRGRGAPEARSS